MSDLDRLLGLAAIWVGGRVPEIGRSLGDVLFRTLDLDLLYLRLRDHAREELLELARVADGRGLPGVPAEIGELLRGRLGREPRTWPQDERIPLEDGDLSIRSVPLGPRGEHGILVAGSGRAAFPTLSDRVLLGVAANQAAVALQSALMLGEEKRVARELDRRVARRTRELTAADMERRDEGLEYIGAVQHVTERRTSETALDKARTDLAHVAGVTGVGTLTASITHEVIQPLSGILINASTGLRMLLAEPPDVDGAKEAARRTIRDGRRASEVITRLRSLFARKETAAEPVDLNEATREIIGLCRSELRGGRVDLRTELAEDLPAVRGDRVQLQQVVLNLLLNAVEAMTEVDDRPRQLVVRTESEGDRWVRLCVRDAGVGIAPDTADRLCEAFYTTKRAGMGLGLSISRSIIESHLGRLWAHPNEDGPGATFGFSLSREARAS